MARTFRFDSAASGLSLGGAFTHRLETVAAGTDTITAAQGSGVNSGYFTTAAGVPGADGAAGNYTVVLNVSAASSGTQASVQLHRINSSGAIQNSSGHTAYQSTATTGDKTYSFTSPSLGTWVAGDRLAVEVRVQNTNAHGGSAGPTFSHTATNARVETPFAVAPIVEVANPGAFSLTGADADLSTPWGVTLDTVDGTTGSYSDLAAEASTDYEYRVVAVNIAGETPSNVDPVTTPSGALEMLAEVGVFAVAGFALATQIAMATSGGSLAVSGVAADLSNASAGMVAEPGTFSLGGTDASFADPSTWEELGSVGGADSAFSDLDAAPSTDYEYRVVAVNAFGETTSNIATVSTPIQSVLTVELRQGATPIASWEVYPETEIATTDLTLTTEQRNAITDWSALRIALIADGDTQIEDTWLQLRAPLPAGALDAVPATFGIDWAEATLSYHAALAAEPAAFAVTGEAAELERIYGIRAELGAFDLTGVDVPLSTALTVDVVAYDLIGSDAAFALASVMSAAAGAFAATGEETALMRSLVLEAESGVFAFAGVDATFAVDVVTATSTGAFAVDGNPAALLSAVVLDADPAAYTVSGATATLQEFGVLDAEPAGYALTGIEATLTALSAEALTADPGSYVLSVASVVTDVASDTEAVIFAVTSEQAALGYDALIDAEPVAYAVNGSTATLQELGVDVVEAAPAVYSLIGASAVADVDTRTSIGAFAATGEPAALLSVVVLDTEQAAYVVTSPEATLLERSALTADPGVFGISGQSAVLDVASTAEAGTFAVTGEAAALTTSLLLEANPASYAVTGESATLQEFGVDVVEADPATYALTGGLASLSYSSILKSDLAEYTFTGHAATLQEFGVEVLDAESGAYALTGTDATLTDLSAETLTANPGVFGLSGQAAALAAVSVLPADPGAWATAGSEAASDVVWRAFPAVYAINGSPVVLFPPTVQEVAEPDDVYLDVTFQLTVTADAMFRRTVLVEDLER